MVRTAQSIRSPAERARVIALARRKITALVKKRAQTALRKSHHKDIEKPKMVKPDALASLAMAKMQMAARHITSKKERRQVVKLAKERIMKDVAKRHKRSPASVHKKHVAATEHKTGSVGHHKKKAVAKVVISKHVQPNATEVMMNVAKALTATLKRT